MKIMPESDTEYVLVTEYFHPDTASTGQLMTDLAVGLEDRGLNMMVLTGQPNYHSGDNERQLRSSEYQGVTVSRIRAPQVRQVSLARRLVNWCVFTVWMSIVLLVDQTDHDRELVFVSNPPFLPVALWLVCRIRGWEYTYIVHDLYPDQPVELGYLSRGGAIDTVWTWLNAHAFRGAKHVVSLGPVMTERIADNAGDDFDVSKVEVIHNWADGEFIQPMDKEENWFSREHGLVNPFSILYSGNIANFHDLKSLVTAAAEFREHDVQFVIIGEGDNKKTVVDIVGSLGLHSDTVSFLPYQPQMDLPYSLTAADVSAVAVKEGFEGVCVSSKLYTALAVGQPVLVIAQPDDDESRIIEQFNAGKHVAQGDIDGIVTAIQHWRENPDLVRRQGRNAREAFEAHFTKNKAIDRYHQLLATI